MKSIFSQFASIVYSSISTRGGIPTKNSIIIEEENKRVLKYLLLKSETKIADSNDPFNNHS